MYLHGNHWYHAAHHDVWNAIADLPGARMEGGPGEGTRSTGGVARVDSIAEQRRGGEDHRA